MIGDFLFQAKLIKLDGKLLNVMQKDFHNAIVFL